MSTKKGNNPKNLKQTIMYKVENILRSNGINTNTINTPNGVLIMADNNDGTYTPFRINTPLKEVYNYLGY